MLALEQITQLINCIASEREALSELANGLIDKADRLSSWNGENCSAWEGVFCSNITGHVMKLDLSTVTFDNERYFDDKDSFAQFSSNCLGGVISSSLLSLKHFQYLDLSMNNFSGIQILAFFGSLKNNISTSQVLVLGDKFPTILGISQACNIFMFAIHLMYYTLPISLWRTTDGL